MPWKYSDRFAKVHSLQYSVPVQSEVILRKRQTLHRLFNTFVSKTVSENFDILPGLLFCVRLNFEVRKSILFLHLFMTLERTGKPRNANTLFEPCCIGTFSPFFWSQTVENSMHTSLKRAPISWKQSFEKKSKTRLFTVPYFSERSLMS